MITREINENNKRAYKIELTEKGNRTAQFLEKKEKEWDDMIREELNMSKEDLFELLSKISLKSLKFNRSNF